MAKKVEVDQSAVELEVLSKRIEELRAALEPFKFEGVLLSGSPGATFNRQVPEVFVARARAVW